MSRTARVVFVDGEPIGYFPPTNAENVEYGNTNVKLALDGLSSGKVNKSGDTMSGNLDIQKSLDSDIFLKLKDTTNNKQIAFGFGTSGKRGIYDYSIDNWIFHMNGTDAYVNNTKVPYNGGTVALKSDIPQIKTKDFSVTFSNNGDIGITLPSDCTTPISCHIVDAWGTVSLFVYSGIWGFHSVELKNTTQTVRLVYV